MQGRAQAMTDTRVCSVEPRHVKCNQIHPSQTGFKRASHAPVVHHVIRPARILLVVEMHVVTTWLHEARDNNKLQSAQEIRCTFLSWLQVTRRKKRFSSHTGKRFFLRKIFYLVFETHLLFVLWKSLFGLFCEYAEDEKKKEKKRANNLVTPFFQQNLQFGVF
jgi:hypothetical protein